MLFKWQSLEKPILGSSMQSCHLLPKKETSVKVEKDPHNFVGGHSQFHEGLDGLHCVPPNVPRFVLEYAAVEKSFQTDEEGVRRQKVKVRIRFVSESVSKVWCPLFKHVLKDDCVFKDNGNIEGFMHVRDAISFRVRLDQKKAITEGVWRRNGLLEM